ncbi:hypothetical protein RJ639_040942 [Escallonia herrerae]|uniref:GDSL esterase/lipase n=1 Tax=Escallonia herrerae TaxID=1293975 RepID=A0AA88WFD9_9ASTE|nr:hypothetical protein RJ639_040942 [Escallonia herrerae]
MVATDAAKKLGLPYASPFYSQNGSIQGFLGGVNFGAAEATIMSPGSPNHQSLNQQLRQAFDTLQLLQLQLGKENAYHFIQSSLFYLSFGKDDYIDLFLQNSSSINLKRNSSKFAHILVGQMMNAIRNLYNAGVKKIACVGVLPLGCTPRASLEMYNSSTGDDRRGCVDDINRHVLEFNTMLEQNIVQFNVELPDAHIVFCDVYRAIMEFIINPYVYGFEDVKSACCGLGRYGGMNGCVSVDMACPQPSGHVWWDLYNPTPAANSLLADSAWHGQPLPNICRPTTIQKLMSSLV